MTVSNGSQTFSNTSNADVTFAGQSDRLTFIGSTTSSVVAEGDNQSVSLVNDSWMVVENASSNELAVAINGSDTNITINDMGHNIRIVLDSQGPYTISNNATGPIGGALLTTAHSSLFVMGLTATTLAQDVTVAK